MEHDPHQPRADEQMSGLFDDLRKFWDAYGTPILWVVVIGSFSLLIYNFVTVRGQTARDEAWSDLAGSTAPASFEQVAQDHENQAVRQLARLKAADLYLREAAGLDGEAQVAKLEEAEALYQQVADDAEHDEFRINGLEGLAVVAEGKRELEEAENRNRAVIELAETMPGFASWSARAEARIRLLPRLAETITFADDGDGMDADASDSTDEISDTATAATDTAEDADADAATE